MQHLGKATQFSVKLSGNSTEKVHGPSACGNRKPSYGQVLNLAGGKCANALSRRALDLREDDAEVGDGDNVPADLRSCGQVYEIADPFGYGRPALTPRGRVTSRIGKEFP